MHKNELYSKTNYIIDIPLILNANIIEYDISKANITMLLSYGLISYDEYIRYCNMDKQMREISIGRRMQEDNGILTEEGRKFIECIKNGIILSKKMLFEANNIKHESVVRIANDAVYINGAPLQYTEFDINNNGVKVSFKNKNIFNIIINLGNVTVFIYDNPMTDKFNVDVKGINDKLLFKHELFLSFICNMVSNVQRSGKEAALMVFNEFYEQYINKQLPLEYYREFNNTSGYRLNGNCTILLDIVNESHRDLINIDYNLLVLRKIYSMIMDI